MSEPTPAEKKILRTNFVILPSGAGFDRRGILWEWDKANKTYTVHTSGGVLTLRDRDAAAFSNWLKIVAVDAPMSHQPTIWPMAEVVRVE